MGPWGSSDILSAFEADDPGSNPGGSVSIIFFPDDISHRNVNIRIVITINVGKNDADLPKLRREGVLFTCILNL
jgi:hypothetical protein